MENALKLPEWSKKLIHHYLSGSYHQFVIDGNIQDYDFCFIPRESSWEFKGFQPVRNILVNVLFHAMPPPANINRIIYFSRTSGIWEISSATPFISKFGNPATLENPDAHILTTSDRDTPQPAASVINELYQLDRVLRAQWQNQAEEKFQVAVIIDHAEQILPDNISSPGLHSDVSDRHYYELIRSWGEYRNMNRAGGICLPNLCVMLTESASLLPAGMRNKESGTLPLTIPRPDATERQRFFSLMAETSDSESPLQSFISDEQNRRKMAMFTKGFSIVDCDRILAMLESKPDVRESLLGEEEVGQKVFEYLQDQTDDVIRSASRGMLEIVNSTITFDNIGGLDGAKQYFERVANAITSDDNPMSREIVPKGVLLAGPPGTGKSLLAKALAQETRLNLVRMGNIRSMWMGESEKNMTLSLNLLRFMAPVIVFVDEIDQALGARSSSSGDSGVSGRIFQQILEFMGDNANRGKVIWVAATNRADLIDDALVSRFDRIIPVLLPGSVQEWHKVMTGIFSQLDITPEPGLLDQFLAKSENKAFLNQHSGRSMETVLRYALQKQIETGASHLSIIDLQESFDNFKTNINANVFELQTLLAIASCNDISFITSPGDDGYSYGFSGVDELILSTLKNRNNGVLDEKVRELKSALGYF